MMHSSSSRIHEMCHVVMPNSSHKVKESNERRKEEKKKHFGQLINTCSSHLYFFFIHISLKDTQPNNYLFPSLKQSAYSFLPRPTDRPLIIELKSLQKKNKINKSPKKKICFSNHHLGCLFLLYLCRTQPHRI